MATGYNRIADLQRKGFLQAVLVAQKLRDLGYDEGDWVFYPGPGGASLIPVDRNVQIRGREKGLVRPDAVQRYVDALKMQEELPPVIATFDDYLVDGVHRTAAARKLKWDSFPQFKLNARWVDAPASEYQKLRNVAAVFNGEHGLPLTSAEKIEAVRNARDPLDTPANVYAKLRGTINRTTVASVMAADDGRKRAKELGFDLADAKHVKQTHYLIFGREASFLTNPVMTEFIALTRDAGLSTPDMQAIARKLKGLHTESDQFALLEEERSNRYTVSPDHRGQIIKPNPAAVARQHAGFFEAYVDVPGLLVEPDPAKQQNHLEHLQVAADVIEKAINGTLERMSRPEA